MMTFQEWLDFKFYPDFDASGLSDTEYQELEDEYDAYTRNWFRATMVTLMSEVEFAD